MKYTLLILFWLFTLPLAGQVSVSVKRQQYTPPLNSDTMYYSQAKKLNWLDFKGQPDKASDATAITFSGFGYNAGVKYLNGKMDISITVYCYFTKTGSWVIKGKETDYALNHEQHHFDITFLVACSFMQKLKEAKFTWANYNQLLDKIYSDSRRQLETFQNQYDGETRNGRLTERQSKWNAKITDQLKEVITN
jgi:hypothetical protein